MPNSNYVLPSPETVSMTGEAARRLIGCGSGDAALVYLYILHSGGRYDIADCAARTGRSEEQIDSAYAVLANLGLVAKIAGPAVKPERAEEIPQYRTEDIEREMENGEAFPKLVAEVTRTLGRMLSGDDLLKLFGIYDYLALPPEVIVQLVSYCVSEVQRSSPGRIPTMRFIEKVAFNWEREGIFSLDAAESYIENQAERSSAYREFAEAMGIRSMMLSATQKKYVDSWRARGYGADAIAIAADRTVTQTGKLSMKYMDSIISSWEKKGLRKISEIQSGDSYAGPKKTENKGAKPQQMGATRTDMEKNRQALKKIKEG